jgi:hypothetical protein
MRESHGLTSPSQQNPVRRVMIRAIGAMEAKPAALATVRTFRTEKEAQLANATIGTFA